MSTRNTTPALAGSPTVNPYARLQLDTLKQDLRNLESARDSWDDSLEAERVSKPAEQLRDAIDAVLATAGKLIGATQIPASQDQFEPDVVQQNLNRVPDQRI